MVQAERPWRWQEINGSDPGAAQGRQQMRQERRTRQRLWEQQFWLFGCDIRRSEGNLLVCHGFERTRREDGQMTSPSYVRDIDPGVTLRLWGFGLALTDSSSGVFVGRKRLGPLLTCKHDVDTAALTTLVSRSVPPARPCCRPVGSRHDAERATHLMTKAFAWIAAYERWVLAEVGHEWRWSTQASWRDPVGNPMTLADDWDRLVARWQARLPDAMMMTRGDAMSSS